MTYVISDIHGCYKEFLLLLKKIKFTADDLLYIIGDAVDRGNEPIKLLLDIMSRPNVVFILGNHEFMMHDVVSKIGCDDDAASKSIDDISGETLLSLSLWLGEGGKETCDQYYKSVSQQKRYDINAYILNASVYEDITVGEKRFILAHAGLNNYVGELDDLTLADFCMYRTDYGRRYFDDENTFLVTGHTPTPNVRTDRQPLIYQENGHIAIDCACVFGGKLAAYCLETGEEFYIDKA